MSSFNETDRALLVDIAQRVARIEQAAADREDHGPRIVRLEAWRLWTVAFSAGVASIAHKVPDAINPLVAALRAVSGHP